MTEALRFPLCKPAGYDVMFQAIALGVVSGATVPQFEMPKPKEGEVIDPSTLGVNTRRRQQRSVTFQVSVVAFVVRPQSLLHRKRRHHDVPETSHS